MFFSICLAFTTTAESETVNPASRALSPSNSFSSKHVYMKPSQSPDLAEQIKSLVDILLQTITSSSKRKYLLPVIFPKPNHRMRYSPRNFCSRNQLNCWHFHFLGKHSVQFTSQLLHMSLEYVNGLMQDAVMYIDREMGSELDRKRAQRILAYLTAKTMELRSFQYGIPEFVCDSGRIENRTGIQDIAFDKWSEMDDRVGKNFVFWFSCCFICHHRSRSVNCKYTRCL